VRHLGRLKCVTDGGTVNDSADILAACEGIPRQYRASTSGFGFRGGTEIEP